jgi:serine/threonine protein kinase/tetratricopeptide (TPR) repeat protein
MILQPPAMGPVCYSGAEMAQATLKPHAAQPGTSSPNGAAEVVGKQEHLDVDTHAAPVRLRTPEELGLDSWKSSFNGSPDQARLFVNLHRSNPEAAHRLAQSAVVLPEVGTELLGFRLLAELGKGAFGRVFLARQGDLADRHVVLKVSPNMGEESRVLARLQHTNIVPIHSFHRAGPLQVVCMPYFGSTTLADVLKEFQGRESLPLSGKDLVGTIVGKKSTVQETEAEDSLTASRAAAEARAQEKSVEPGLVPTAVGSRANLDVLQGLNYVEAILWVGSRLADGLAHAHERGIVHRDLKPANVLLTDEGQPMLLDFNLAQDTKLSSSAAAQVGGTLPFMAPEEIEAYQTETCRFDFRGDIYGLGVILYELLTGRHPFQTHRGLFSQVLEKMIRERQGPPPMLRCWNKAISPAVESIIRHCLEPDLSKRYQNARQLKEDLDRHLDNLPLCHAPEPSLRERTHKWMRRHPRLASTTTMGIVTIIMTAGLLSLTVMRGQRLAEMDAREALGRFLDDKKTVQYLLTARTQDTTQLENGIDLCRQVLGSYGVLDNPSWQEQPGVRRLGAEDQAVLRASASELLLLLARGLSIQASDQGDELTRAKLVDQALKLNALAHACSGAELPSRAVRAQRAELASLLGREEEARQERARAQATPLVTAVDHYLAATEHIARGRFQQAQPLLAAATEQNPQDFWAWFLQGVCHDNLAQGSDAIASYNTCIALSPNSPWAYLNRGLAHLRHQDYRKASADLDRAIALKPNLAEAFRNRALARQGLKKYAEAVDDLTRALELGTSPTHVYFIRAEIRERAGDPEGAKQDRAEAVRCQPTDEMGWLSRGYARMAIDPSAALDDFDHALAINPRSLVALQNKAHILSKLGKNAEAAQALDKAIDFYPDFVRARAGRGVLLARLGERDAALQDASDCLAQDNKPLTLYQLAGIYALTSQKHADDRRQAFRLLSLALQKGCGFDLLETDKDLDPIRDSAEFRKLVDAARAIRAADADKSKTR